MLSNPIRATNNSQMVPGGAGISRSQREKILHSSFSACSYAHSVVKLVFCMYFGLFQVGLHSACISFGQQEVVCLLMGLKMLILSNPLINCLPAVTTANTHSSTLSHSVCRALKKCSNDISLIYYKAAEGSVIKQKTPFHQCMNKEGGYFGSALRCPRFLILLLQFISTFLNACYPECKFHLIYL